jgi:hypothetical protein
VDTIGRIAPVGAVHHICCGAASGPKITSAAVAREAARSRLDKEAAAAARAWCLGGRD